MNKPDGKKAATLLRILRKSGVFLFWILIWGLAAFFVKRDVLLPSPLSVLKRLGELCITGDYWQTVLRSLIRIFAGFAIASSAAILTGFLTWKSKIASELLAPVLTVIRATPVASFIILALVWMSRAAVPAFTSFLMVFPIVWSSVDTALRGADPMLGEVTDVFRFTSSMKLRTLYLPAIRQPLLASLKTSLGMAWKAGIAAEVLCTPTRSIGASISDAKIYLETTDLFAWTLTVILFSMLLEWLFTFLYKKLSGKSGMHPIKRKGGGSL